MDIILASSSPRRREILDLLRLPFQVIAPEFDERPLPDRPIREEVFDFALGKARSIARDHPESVVIGSDTMILLDGQKIGKPRGAEEAIAMLRALSGKTHRIYTAVAIINGAGPDDLTMEEVSVAMRGYSEQEIESYFALGESLDKAGAYSIQGGGRDLIRSIEGDYLAAVGLPLRPITDYLKKRGVVLPVDIDQLYADKPFANWRSF